MGDYLTKYYVLLDAGHPELDNVRDRMELRHLEFTTPERELGKRFSKERDFILIKGFGLNSGWLQDNVPSDIIMWMVEGNSSEYSIVMDWLEAQKEERNLSLWQRIRGLFS